MPYLWQHPDWPRFKWDSHALLVPLGRARSLQGKLVHQVAALGFEAGRAAQAEILSEEAIKTAAIEGERLNPESVRSSVARHLGLSAAGLKPVERHVDGLVEVLLDATTHDRKPLSARRLKSWQAALFPTGFSGLHKIHVGRWRGADPMRVVSGPVGCERVHFEAPPSKKVDAEMKRFLAWWKQSFGKTEGLIRAGVAHLYFVTIHPFEDGNGRVARALTDMALAQDEGSPTRYYSLSQQVLVERESYYDELERARDIDITEWLSWFLACLGRAIEASQKLISKVLAKAEFWRRHAQVPMSDHQRKVMNRLLDAGPGGFEGGLTTRKYVALAKVSRATAYREIADLVAKKVLISNQGQGRNVSYDVIWL